MMARILLATLLGVLSVLWGAPAYAQSTCPFIYTPHVLTQGEWQSCFTAKQDTLGFQAVNKGGDVLTGGLTFPASGTAVIPIIVPQGSTPSNPPNGALWATAAGFAGQINGQTVLLGGVGGNNPGGSSGALQYNNNGGFGGFLITGDIALSAPSGVATVNSFNGGTPFGTAASQNLSYPIASNAGGTGVNNGSNTLTLLESLSATGGFALQLNTSGVTEASFPSGTHTMASTDGTGQSITGGAVVPTGNYQVPTGNFTVGFGNGPLQWQLNCGNWTITAPTANDGATDIQIVNACGSSTAIGSPTLTGFAPMAGAGYSYANTPTQSGVSVTVSSASPGVITWASHGLKPNSPVYLTAVAMPGGLNQYQIYYVVGSSITTNTFEVAAAPNGTAINTSTTGTTVLGYEPSVWVLHVETIMGMSNYNWLQWQ